MDSVALAEVGGCCSSGGHSAAALLEEDVCLPPLIVQEEAALLREQSVPWHRQALQEALEASPQLFCVQLLKPFEDSEGHHHHHLKIDVGDANPLLFLLLLGSLHNEAF